MKITVTAGGQQIGELDLTTRPGHEQIPLLADDLAKIISTLTPLLKAARAYEAKHTIQAPPAGFNSHPKGKGE